MRRWRRTRPISPRSTPARRAVRAAELNLGYTTITSPIDGVVGRAQLRQGGMVTANNTLLTTIYQTDRMYMNFSISEQRLLTYAAPARPRAEPELQDPAAVSHLSGGRFANIRRHRRLNFIDPAVDTRTGTLAMRLEVDNPQHLLHAGQFARVQVAAAAGSERHLGAAARGPGSAGQELRLDRRCRRARRSSATCRWVRASAATGRCSRDSRPARPSIVDGVQRLKPGTPVKATPLDRQPAHGRARGSLAAAGNGRMRPEPA